MLEFNGGTVNNEEHRPCSVFDMICGVGSGGQVEYSHAWHGY
jgi:hypothetical protein